MTTVLDPAALDRFIEGALPSAEELAAIVAALGDARKAVQRRAAEALVALDRRGLPVRALVEALLAAPASRGRWGAAFTLGQLGVVTAPLLDALIDALGDPDGDVRWAAAQLLTQLPAHRPVGDRLAGAVRTGSALQRKMALYCLRDLHGWTPAREALALGALSDPDPPVRLAALATLARRAVDRAAVAPSVAALLADDDAGVRRGAAAALGRLGVDTPAVRGQLDHAVGGADAALARAAAGALRRLGLRG